MRFEPTCPRTPTPWAKRIIDVPEGTTVLVFRNGKHPFLDVIEKRIDSPKQLNNPIITVKSTVNTQEILINVGAGTCVLPERTKIYRGRIVPAFF